MSVTTSEPYTSYWLSFLTSFLTWAMVMTIQRMVRCMSHCKKERRGKHGHPIQGQGSLDPYAADQEQKRLMLQRFQEEVWSLSLPPSPVQVSLLCIPISCFHALLSFLSLLSCFQFSNSGHLYMNTIWKRARYFWITNHMVCMLIPQVKLDPMEKSCLARLVSHSNLYTIKRTCSVTRECS